MSPSILSLFIAVTILMRRVDSQGDCMGNISLSEFQGLRALFVSTQGENWLWNPNLPLTTHWHFSASIPTPNMGLNYPCQASWQGLSCAYSILPNSPGLCTIQNISLIGMNLVGSIPSAFSQCINVEVTLTTLIVHKDYFFSSDDIF